MASPVPASPGGPEQERGTTAVNFDFLPCVTQDPREPAGADFLAVCTEVGEHIACSIHCRGTGCGGHLVCSPCFDLAREKGMLDG